MQSLRVLLPSVILACCLALSASRPALALPQETLHSVVSVLPVWPGRAQGGAGAPPGVAPEGSGVVMRSGVIATAWHVVEPAERIDVRLHDGRILPATLLAADAASDIALLSVEADLRPFALAPPPELADPVCAVGNAYGLGLSVTCGVVSARNVTDAGFNAVEDFVQTDAATNPGVSGGALVDGDGRLVGMMSAIFASETDGNIGINFAVSGELLERVIDALMSEGAVSYPRPGWRLGDASRAQLARLAAPVVEELSENGPAARAGVALGDLVLEVGGRPIRTPRDAIAALAVLPDGTRSTDLLVFRAGEEEQLALRIGDDPQPPRTTDAGILGDCPHPEAVCLFRQAVFPVSSFDPLGSATRIGPDLLVTNRHVVGDRPDAVVHTPDGPRGARVLPSAYGGDLVLLETAGLPSAGHVPELSSADDTESTEYFTIGADISRQEVRVFEPGTLIAPPAEGAPLGRIHVTARMQPGVSGGALVDETGRLVGIAVGGGEGRFEAVPLDGVRALLRLREDAHAAERQADLGAALVACAASLEAAALSGQGARYDAVTDTCAAGQNHGQLLEAGRVLAIAGDIAGAAALHAQAVEQVPNSANARLSLLVSLQLGGRFEEMIPHARHLMEIVPDDPQVLRFVIQSGVWGGDPEFAETGYEALLKADPRQAEAARRFIDAAPAAPAGR